MVVGVGGILPYEKVGNAIRLAWGYNSRILVSLKVFRTKRMI